MLQNKCHQYRNWDFFPAASCSEISILCIGCVLRSRRCCWTPGGRGHPPTPTPQITPNDCALQCVYIFTLGDRWECARGEKCEIQLESRSTLCGLHTHSPPHAWSAPSTHHPQTGGPLSVRRPRGSPLCSAVLYPRQHGRGI